MDKAELIAAIEALTGSAPWADIRFGRPDTINAMVDLPGGDRLVANGDTPEQALEGLLEYVRSETLTQTKAA